MTDQEWPDHDPHLDRRFYLEDEEIEIVLTYRELDADSRIALSTLVAIAGRDPAAFKNWLIASAAAAKHDPKD